MPRRRRPLVLLRDCLHLESWRTPLFSAPDYVSCELFIIQRCDICGLVQTYPRLSGEQVVRYYPHGYYGREKRYSKLLENMLAGLYAFRAWRLETLNGSGPGQVFDIGCGRGLLLYQLRRRGWAVSGSELTDLSAQYAREILQLSVAVGDVVDLGLPDESFSAIILWHVLEHLVDPDAVLRDAARLLYPGGTILVAVPNFSSIESRWSKSRWFHLDVPRHLHHFTPQTLQGMLQGVGLEVYHADYFAPEYDFFSFVQTSLNMLGIRQNTLYNLLRTSDAKLLQGHQSPHLADIIASLLLAPILGLISLIWVPLMVLSRRGATVTLYARKL